ncbi:hypothetical protein BH23VER1_BH23VER1_14690 [soil metagenome]
MKMMPNETPTDLAFEKWVSTIPLMKMMPNETPTDLAFEKWVSTIPLTNPARYLEVDPLSR